MKKTKVYFEYKDNVPAKLISIFIMLLIILSIFYPVLIISVFYVGIASGRLVIDKEE